MKLLFCLRCGDIFNLKLKTVKKCSCQQTQGVYLDYLNAVYLGPCTPIGFANSTFNDAMIEQPENGWGEEFTAFIIPKICETFVNLNTNNVTYENNLRKD